MLDLTFAAFPVFFLLSFRSWLIKNDLRHILEQLRKTAKDLMEVTAVSTSLPVSHSAGAVLTSSQFKHML